jgi:Nicotianamine synthase protein
MTEAEATQFLKAAHETLARQTDLSPNNPEVNACLSRLVSTLRRWQADGFGADLAGEAELAEVASELPRLCAIAECEMEKWWCRKILASECPGAQALQAFWYLDEYEALHQAELALLGETRTARFAFLGSGALPVTAILIARDCDGTSVTCVDCDGEACELADRLIALLGLKHRVTVADIDAADYASAPDETIICASLLRAPGLFDILQQRRTARLIIRDAEGPYRFCYRPAALPGRGFVERARSPVSSSRINTSRYFEACHEAAGLAPSPSSADMIS